MDTTMFSSALIPNLFQYELNTFEAIFELADQNTYSYESTQDLLRNYYLIRLFCHSKDFKNALNIIRKI